MGSFSPGSTGPHFTSSSHFSPTTAPLRISLEQAVQPTLSHPETQPHLLAPNPLRCAIVDSHGSNALNCCSSSSCSTCPAIPGAFVTNCHGYFFLRAAASVGPLTYHIGATFIQQDCYPRHYQLQHITIDVLTADSTYTWPSFSCRRHCPAAKAYLLLTTQHSTHPHHCSSDLHCCTDALRCKRTSLRAYARCCTSVLGTSEWRLFTTVVSPLCHMLEFSER